MLDVIPFFRRFQITAWILKDHHHQIFLIMTHFVYKHWNSCEFFSKEIYINCVYKTT
jgi:hypothetical protein